MTTPNVVPPQIVSAPQHLVSCWTNNAPCQVFAPIAERLPADVDTSEVESELPCAYCPVALAHWCDHLPRLGTVRRRILLSAAPDRFSVLTPETDTRAGNAAQRRAILDLWRAGLVWISREAITQRFTTRPRWDDWFGEYRTDTYTRAYKRRSVQLSPLGAALVARVRAALESGARIRWDDHRAALVEECAESPAALVARLRRDITERQTSWRAIASISAQLRSRSGAHEGLAAAAALGKILEAFEAETET